MARFVARRRYEYAIKFIILYLIAAFVGALGQALYKEGSGASQLTDPVSLLTNWRLLLGVGCYIAVMVLFVAAFRIGGELTVLYPVYATTFLWAAVLGVFLLDESFGVAKGLGVALIIAGVFFTAR